MFAEASLRRDRCDKDRLSYAMEGRVFHVFDTSFEKSTPLKLKDMSLFIEGILQLLDDFPEFLVIFKEKKSRDEVHAGIIPYLKKIDNHPRCIVPGCDTEPSEIIKVSDLVISACFTNTALEALGTKRKSIRC